METRRPLTRRDALRLLGGAALAVVPAIGVAEHASAGRTWCRLDPVIRVNGRLANIYVSTYIDAKVEATGPTIVYIAVPPGATTELLEVDNGFGYGYGVRFLERRELTTNSKGVEIQVGAYVPSINSAPLLVEIVPGGSKTRAKAEGVTNQAILLLKARI